MNKFKWIQTSIACPIQFNIELDGVQVGYYRSRSGAAKLYKTNCIGEILWDEPILRMDSDQCGNVPDLTMDQIKTMCECILLLNRNKY